MKKESEIKKALECCSKGNHCRSDCPYDNEDDSCVECTSMLSKDVLDLLERNEDTIKAKSNVIALYEEMLEHRAREIEMLTIEKDNLVKEMTEVQE